MKFFLGFVTLLLLSVAFFTPPIASEQTVIVRYLSEQWAFFQHYLLYVILGFCVMVSLIFRWNFDKHLSPVRIFVFSMTQSVMVLVIGFFASFALLWTIAWIQVTIYSLLFSMSPGALGIQTDPQLIVRRLSNQHGQVAVVLADTNPQKIPMALSQSASGTTNIYGKHFLSDIPTWLIIPVRTPDASLLLFDNTVIVTTSTSPILQEISPVLAYAVVKDYFSRRRIKAYPKISFMNKDEYTEFRQDDAKDKLHTIDVQIATIDGYISSISAQLETDQRQRRQLQKLLIDYKYYDTYFKNQREKLASTSNHVPNELGSFTGPDQIKLIFDPSYKKDAIHYFATLVHEYLHYTSFVSDKQRFSSVFFEEAFTEYFSRRIIESEFGRSTNVGYPLQEKVLSELLKMYTDGEIAEIYFSKDDVLLEKALNRVYGEHFYEENFVAFETMMYTSDKRQALTLANKIMEKIGGRKLTEQDALSTGEEEL